MTDRRVPGLRRAVANLRHLLHSCREQVDTKIADEERLASECLSLEHALDAAYARIEELEAKDD